MGSLLFFVCPDRSNKISIRLEEKSTYEIKDQIGEGDKVFTRWAVRRRHTGDFMGIPPTGREVVMRGTYTVLFSDGKVVEQWAHTDMLDFLRQLGFDIDRALREQMIEQGKQL